MMALIRRLPVVATIVVLIAIGVMIRLGFWQLDRSEEKALMLARYEAASRSGAEVIWPSNEEELQARLYGRTRLDCAQVTGTSAIAGKSGKGESGLAVAADCRTSGGDEAMVILGWSREPVSTDWDGGEVRGIIAPGPRIVADPPLAGLDPNAVPDPSELPNNHLAYAVQWFLFAATALVIYGLAVRKRLAGRGSGR